MNFTKDFAPELTALRLRLGADFGIISRINGDTYEVIKVSSDFDAIKERSQFKTRDTYCDKVISTRQTVTYSEVGRIHSMVLHPIYTAMQLEAYIGEPLSIGHDVIGTLNFSSLDPKKGGFSDEEILAVKTLARAIEKHTALTEAESSSNE